LSKYFLGFPVNCGDPVYSYIPYPGLVLEMTEAPKRETEFTFFELIMNYKRNKEVIDLTKFINILLREKFSSLLIIPLLIYENKLSR